jgi:hypothetical protein
VLPARDLRARAAAIRAEPITGAEPIGIDDAVVLARAAVPDAELTFVLLPTRPGQPFRVGLLRNDQERGAPVISVFVDPWARRMIEVLDPHQFSIGERILAWQHGCTPERLSAGCGRSRYSCPFLSGFLPPLGAAAAAGQAAVPDDQGGSLAGTGERHHCRG